MAEAHVPPDPNRRTRAWRGGLRPRTRWWVVAAQAVMVAALLSTGVGAMVRVWFSGALTAAFESGGLGFSTGAWVGVLAIAPAMAIAAALVAAGLGGALGPIRPRELQRVAPTRRRGSSWQVVAAFSVLGVAAIGAIPVLAAGARAVAGSEAILAELWHTWAVRIFVGMGVLLGIAGLGEVVLERFGIRRSLYRTMAQARRDAEQGERR